MNWWVSDARVLLAFADGVMLELTPTVGLYEPLLRPEEVVKLLSVKVS